MVEDPEASQSKAQSAMGPNAPPSKPMDFVTVIFSIAIWRHYLRQEPGAGNPHAGIWARCSATNVSTLALGT